MNAGNPDLRPFRERVLEAIDLKQPGSGSLSGHDVLCFLRERIGSWVDERLRFYERTSAEVEELRADRVKLQGEIERLTHELAEARATRPFPPEAREVKQDGRLFAPYGLPGKYREAGEIEALAQRLAKVEDRLAEKGFDDAFHIGAGLKRVAALEKRLDQVVEIFANANMARVADHSELRKQVTALQDLLGEHSRPPGAFYYATRIAQLADAVHELNPGWGGWKGTDGPQSPFPTGAGTTVEDAIAQVEEPGAESDTSPPRRGDRVRLEGARSIVGTPINDGWFDVVGDSKVHFQVAGFAADDTPLFWVRNDDPGLKEVRRGAANLPE